MTLVRHVLQFWTVLVCYSVCLLSLVWEFWIYAVCNFCAFHTLFLQAFFIPLCEPGEISWFAERANWFQPVSFNDESIFLSVCLFNFICFWLLLLFLVFFADKIKWAEGALDRRWRRLRKFRMYLISFQLFVTILL